MDNKEKAMTDTSKSWVMYIPQLAREKIFCSLPGETLHIARQVCSHWNNYVKNEIWGTRKNKKVIEERLESNWYNDRNVETTDYHDLPIDGYVDAVSPTKAVVRSHKQTPLEVARIAVFDIPSKTFWTVENVFNDFLLICAKFDDFCVCVSDNILAVRTRLRADVDIQNLQIWNNSSKERILEQNMANLRCFHTCKTEDQDLLILLTNFIEVWQFLPSDRVVKVRIPANNCFLQSGTYINPYIVTQTSNSTLTKTKVVVYKHGKNPLSIESHIKIDDLDNYWHQENGEIMKFKVGELCYPGEFFLVSCVLDVPCGRNKSFKCLALRVMGNDGTFIRQVCFDTVNPKADVTFYVFGGRLMMSIDEIVLIQDDKLQELVKKDSNKTIGFNLLRDLNGEKFLLFTKFSALEVGIVTFLDSSAK